jgi:hypothetical protein
VHPANSGRDIRITYHQMSKIVRGPTKKKNNYFNSFSIMANSVPKSLLCFKTELMSS